MCIVKYKNVSQIIYCSASEQFLQPCILLSATFPVRLVLDSTLSTLNLLLRLFDTSLLNIYALFLALYSIFLWYYALIIFTMNKSVTYFSASSVFPLL